jgi:hypothetical protein
MSLNRKKIEKQLSMITSDLLREKGYISFIDIFMNFDKLSKEDYEKWRFHKVPYLEKVIKINLNKVNFIMRTVQKNSRNGGLGTSKTVYKFWGKGPKKLLKLFFSNIIKDDKQD